MRFAINHITAPELSLAQCFATVRRIGLTEVEIRNDLPDIVGTMDPAVVKAEAEKAGVTIISINALFPSTSGRATCRSAPLPWPIMRRPAPRRRSSCARSMTVLLSLSTIS